MALPALVGALGRAAGSVGAGASAAGASQTGANLTTFANRLNAVTFAAHNANSVLGALGGSIGSMASPLTRTVGLFRKMEGAVTGLGTAVSHFVAKASPAHVKLFTFAVSDFQAVIGRGLLPVMQFATQTTRAFADVFGAFSGPLNQLLSSVLRPLGAMLPGLVNMMGPVAESFGHLVRGITAITRPFNSFLVSLARVGALLGEVSFTVMAKGLEVLITPLELAGLLMMDFARAVDNLTGGLVTWIRDLLGLKEIDKGSVGAAVRDTQMGSVESFQQKAMLAAFMGGMPDKPEVKTATLAEKIHAWLMNDLPALLLRLPGLTAEMLAAEFNKRFPETVATAKEAGKMLADPLGTANELFRDARNLGRQIEGSGVGRTALGFVDPLNVLGAR